MIQLIGSGVVYNEEAHTYTLRGKELKGITSTLIKYIFPDKYADVPQEVMAAAAEYGKRIHKSIELYINDGDHDYSQEVTNFEKAMASAQLRPFRAEYIVTDNDSFASPIDIVAEDSKGGIVLLDTKTTSGGLDKDSVSWQLSIYAYLFEKQNPTLRVSSLMGFWVRNDEWAIEPIYRHPSEEVKQLIQDYLLGLSCMVQPSCVPMSVQSIANIIAEKERAIKELEAERDAYKDTILAAMQQFNCDSINLDGLVTITRVKATTRESFDSAKFRKAYPDLYTGYIKTSNVKESLRITIKR